MIAEGPATSVWRGSSIAIVRASQVRSASIPRCAASTRKRVVRSGSTTSTEIGPTRVAVRSAGSRADAKKDRCTPSRRTLNAASMMSRFG